MESFVVCEGGKLLLVRNGQHIEAFTIEKTKEGWFHLLNSDNMYSSLTKLVMHNQDPEIAQQNGLSCALKLPKDNRVSEDVKKGVPIGSLTQEDTQKFMNKVFQHVDMFARCANDQKINQHMTKEQARYFMALFMRRMNETMEFFKEVEQSLFEI